MKKYVKFKAREMTDGAIAVAKTKGSKSIATRARAQTDAVRMLPRSSKYFANGSVKKSLKKLSDQAVSKLLPIFCTACLPCTAYITHNRIELVTRLTQNTGAKNKSRARIITKFIQNAKPPKRSKNIDALVKDRNCVSHIIAKISKF